MSVPALISLLLLCLAGFAACLAIERKSRRWYLDRFLIGFGGFWLALALVFFVVLVQRVIF